MNFKPGEKARLVNPSHMRLMDRRARKYLGEEVTVVSELGLYGTLVGGMGYEIRALDGTQMWCVPTCLERAQPPKEQVGSWESTPYGDLIRAPKKEPVEACSA